MVPDDTGFRWGMKGAEAKPERGWNAVPVVTMKQLLEAGVHFGHQTRRWNPKMAPFIFTQRNGIHIIDLQKSVPLIEGAYKFVRETAAAGGSLVFVGTKKQAQDAIREEAIRAHQFYVNQRWLGGMLTNFNTIKSRIDRLKELAEIRDNGTLEILPKREQAHLMDELARLEKYLGGIATMRTLPAAMYVVDTRKEHIAIAEARKLRIPVVAIIDTNCDPDEADYPIPGNDDAIRAVRLITNRVANAAQEGYEEWRKTQVIEEEEVLAAAEEGVEPAPMAPLPGEGGVVEEAVAEEEVQA